MSVEYLIKRWFWNKFVHIYCVLLQMSNLICQNVMSREFCREWHIWSQNQKVNNNHGIFHCIIFFTFNSQKNMSGVRCQAGLHLIFFVLYPRFFKVKLFYRAHKLKYIKTRQKYVYYVFCLLTYVSCLLFYVL